MNKTWTIIIVILVIIAGIWWFNGGSSNLALAPGASSSPTAVGATKTPAASKAGRTVTPAPAPVTTPVLSYSQLVAQYGANRIQFDANCQAQPSSIVLKTGTSILLDNRSSQARTISVEGRNYSLVGYGYQIITPTGSVPRNIMLGCGSSLNVGTIQLQANISGQ